MSKSRTAQKAVISPEVARAFAALPREQKHVFIASLTDAEAVQLKYLWEAWARDKQLEPQGSYWTTWLIMAGRGFGKTRCGAEWIRKQAESKKCERLALVGRTAADVRDVMIDGESGILAISPPWFMPRFEGTRRRLRWPNGAIATTYSAEEPNSLRGPQHDGAWADEPAAWQYPDAWDQLMFGLRLGRRPRVVATTTPRATKFVKTLVKQPTTHVTNGTTYENRENLAPTFIDQVVRRYQGTQLGRQELEGQLIEDAEGALWHREELEAHRVTSHPDLVRIVVGVDPPASSGEGAAEAGIIVAGLGSDGHGYVLADRSRQGSPLEWAMAAVTAYYVFVADRIIGESNQGGEMVEFSIRTVDPNVSFKAVHASRGKYVRAEPISSLYEQGRMHHVGYFSELEDQLCQWVPGEKSPDRLDALVWAFTELAIDGGDIPFAATNFAASSGAILSVGQYMPAPGEMEQDAEEALARRQEQLGNLLRDLASGQFRR